MNSKDDAYSRFRQMITGGAAAPQPTPPSAAPAPWRQARCQSITLRCMATTGDPFAFSAYTLAHFGQAELQRLTDAQLEQTWQHVRATSGAR